MSHSLNRIWVHGVFRTIDNSVIIPPDHEQTILNHLKNTFENDLKCNVRIINSGINHIHILFMLNPNICIRDIFQRSKGESSHWCNQINLTYSRFAWQTGYGAFSVSESNLKLIEQYIRNQKEHHKRISFQEEFDKLIEEAGIIINP